MTSLSLLADLCRSGDSLTRRHGADRTCRFARPSHRYLRSYETTASGIRSASNCARAGDGFRLSRAQFF
jgi:hypothetical protein